MEFDILEKYIYIYILPLFPFKNLKSREEQFLITVLTADTSYFI